MLLHYSNNTLEYKYTTILTYWDCNNCFNNSSYVVFKNNLVEYDDYETHTYF